MPYLQNQALDAFPSIRILVKLVERERKKKQKEREKDVVLCVAGNKTKIYFFGKFVLKKDFYSPVRAIVERCSCSS